MDLKKRTEEFINKNALIAEDDIVVVGVSGGADSICLLHIMSDISKDCDFSVVAVHVHHGIRGAEADRDAEFSRQAAERLNIPFELCSVDVPAYADEKGLTVEEAARILRYRELERVCNDCKASKIALAHHADDQAETVIMNLLRGTGPVGLAGIRVKNGNRIRPLLFASKNEILEYLNGNDINYVEDSTNSDINYTRNRIRHELLPLAENIYPGASKRVAATAGDMAVWDSFIREETINHAGKTGDKDGIAFIPADVYKDCPVAIRESWVRMAVASVIPGRKDVTRDHYRMLTDLLDSDVTGREICLPRGCRGVRTYEGLEIRRSDVHDAKSGEKTGLPEGGICLSVPGEISLYLGGENMRVLTELVDVDIFNQKKQDFSEDYDYIQTIDCDRIEHDLVWRHPKKGDYFVMDASGNKKMLRRHFIDAKVPREQRSSVPVLADGDHVVWVYPDRLSEAFKVTSSTKRVMIIRVLRPKS